VPSEPSDLKTVHTKYPVALHVSVGSVARPYACGLAGLNVSVDPACVCAAVIKNMAVILAIIAIFWYAMCKRVEIIRTIGYLYRIA